MNLLKKPDIVCKNSKTITEMLIEKSMKLWQNSFSPGYIVLDIESYKTYAKECSDRAGRFFFPDWANVNGQELPVVVLNVKETIIELALAQAKNSTYLMQKGSYDY